MNVPVFAGKNGMSNPPPDTFNDELGGQSFDVGPNGPLPPTRHAGLPMMPVHVPVSPGTQSCMFGLPQSQIGHGALTALPRCTSELKRTLISAAPVWVS